MNKNEHANSERPEVFAAVVISDEAVRILNPILDIDALALFACVADDPACWSDLVMLWPRGRYHEDSPEFLDALAITEREQTEPRRDSNATCGIAPEVEAVLNATPGWFVIDLPNSRVFSGGRFPKFKPRRQPDPVSDEPYQLVALPPWWELHQACSPSEIHAPRATTVARRSSFREFLWSRACTDFLSASLLEAVRAAERDDVEWQQPGWEDRRVLKHDVVVQVHREWLMTPREDLSGECPRDCLHRGRDWVEDIVSGQRFRVDHGEGPVPVSEELSTYELTPFGRHELIMYFEACRESIGAVGAWLIQDTNRIHSKSAQQDIAAMMWDYFQSWLSAPFEGGRPPRDVIRCERARIPLVSTPEDHAVDCDCPICDMMVSGMFGPAICHFDGHELELDNDFAFSMCATQEEWDKQQADWAEWDARIKADMAAEEKRRRDEGDEDASSVRKSTSVNSDGAIPGDTFGHLGLAFHLAEIVGQLKDINAPQHDINKLNDAFREYRNADPLCETPTPASAFIDVLEELAQRHECIVGRSADLQSRIHELERHGPPIDDVPW